MRKLLVIVFLISFVLSCSYCSAEIAATTDKEILFLNLKIGTSYSEVQKYLSKYDSSFYTKKVALFPMLSSYYDQELFSEIGLPYCKTSSYDAIRQYNISTFKNEKVAGYKLSIMSIYYAPFALDNVDKALKNENDYSMIGGTYTFSFSDSSLYADEGRKTSNPYIDGMKMYEDLKNKLAHLYGEPIEITGRMSEKDKKGVIYYSNYALWVGENNTGVLLSYIPGIISKDAKTKYYRSNIFVDYGRTDMNKIIKLYEDSQSYEGL